MAKLGGSQLFLCVLALVAATTTAADLPGFIERYGRTFWTEGSEFLFNGFNAYWLMGDAASPHSNGSKVTALFEEAAAAGLTVCRTWAFYDGFSNDSLQVTPGVYHEQVFKAWVQEMATFLKSIDRKHLLGVGLEGFYGSSTPDKVKLYNPNAVQIGVDFIGVHKVNEIDYATVHAYPDFWLEGQSEVNKTEFVKQWLWNHWKDSMEVLGKPFMLGEFGKTKKDPGYSEQIRNDFYSTVYDSIYSISKDGHKTFTGGLLWQLFVDGMESYYDGFEIILSQDASATALILNQSKKMGELAGAA
ncbi:hypothetical protein ZIOFF_031646 [Zingiber officinale]|uniref:mannan endo-1,4-beta-mannosidase n=1 Tax=Zingiber officinale TaxID=94328 RepID=A0A8J5GU78_ZINOF|nr:hypothetical protein ZIOFF_031646 [Zingiber officinale]